MIHALRHTLRPSNLSLDSMLETLYVAETEMNNSKEKYEGVVKDSNINSYLVEFYKNVYQTNSKIFINQHKAYLDLLVEIEKKL